MAGMSVHYNTRFYQGLSGSSYHAALEILPVIFRCVAPRSVVDLGCGVGSWLAAALKYGATRAVGLEGD